ncbi:MAG: type 12 methyltransferase [Candidatus Woesebacteria bacterium GW2011_GWA1_40_43]|uniref:Type 12 methyltransferase n=1 Tax=Candidatus Woesebacteria bacterium GW2011_GWA1_40_43 TaxID=1618553 RepID=A0A0G0SJE1_9BACT|nr:MAG: type 12 methyltransferase [Candidatus Woesebacteria bacterium GW2011_GWA1_40_43]
MSQNIFQKLYYRDLQKVYKSFSTSGGEIILDNVIGDVPDLQTYFEDLRKIISSETKVLISYHNHKWEPILNLASSLGLRKKVGVQNWLDQDDLKNILYISGFEVVNTQSRFFGITSVTVVRPKLQTTRNKNQYSVSIIVPARNEEGNIKKIISSIPKFGKWQEIIFVEGGSSDHTWDKIMNEKFKITNKSQNSKSKIQIKAYKQTGKGKADAVRLGFEKATGDILMIYDADRTVPSSDLPKFYNVLAGGFGEFANGSRLVYPFGQHFKDTLCGTKAIFRDDYLKMKKDYLKYLEVDPFGDFALIFAAIKHNLKVVEIPVRYREREYGSTNIRRFYHGLLLFKLAWIALKEFKF